MSDGRPKDPRQLVDDLAVTVRELKDVLAMGLSLTDKITQLVIALIRVLPRQ
jgi:hypothetical protein